MKYIFITAALLTSPLVQAATDEAHHVISAGAGMGFLSGEMDQGNNDFELNYDFAYRYQFDNYWGAEVGYRHQDVTFTNWFDSAFDKYSLNDAESFRIAAVYSYPLSLRNRLVLKLGVTDYSIDATDYREDSSGINDTVDGNGLLASVGWRFDFNMGLELAVIYSYQDLDIIETHSYTTSLGYRF